MKLNARILKDQKPPEKLEGFKSCYNARGLYDSMQFVLRLRPDLHHILEKVEGGIVNTKELDFETVQAFSTYFHETIHWWQHVGSVSGLILSLSYPAQAHINHSYLKDFIEQTGLKKPILKYNELYSNEDLESKEFDTVNTILNNFYDIEFFKYRVVVPDSFFNCTENPYFESVGHSFFIAYSSFVNLLSSCFDPDLKFLPNAKKWPKSYKNLRDKKVEGYYHGSSVGLPPVGLKEIYEGQARFLQIQYLYFASGGNLTWSDFEALGMLSGVYYLAFSVFLEFTDSKRPDSIDSPLIALFLLVLDLSMNPSDGFPFDIVHFGSFIESVDPGIRFLFLCRKIAQQHPEFKTYIRNYSSSEYYEVSTKLSKSILCPSPFESANLISSWSEEQPSIKLLLDEEKIFTFGKENMPIRLIFSRFVRYQLDKLRNPAYFCWPGVYCAGEKVSEDSARLFDEHRSLFCDKQDGDIYPRTFPDKDPSAVQETFDSFYSWVATYDLSRQWIIEEGSFSYDYWWLTSKYAMSDLEDWASRHFEFVFGVKPQMFEILS